MPRAPSKAERQLETLASELAQTPEDPLRLELVRTAQRFKRSWLELAAALVRVRDARAYERWGYPSLHAYCANELQIKPGTADKLALSYNTLERHAPRVLERDGMERETPSYQAIHYYARAVDGEDTDSERFVHLDPREREETFDALHRAVFEENQPLVELRRRFEPVLHPKPQDEVALEVLHKLRTASLKVSELLVQADGLPQARIEQLEAGLEQLRQDLELRITGLRGAQPKRSRHAADAPRAEA